MRILIIEDEEALRELLEYGLSKAGYQITALDNASQALITLEDWLPELILLDLMLPGLQGLQFLDILRQTDKKLPVMVISARNSEKDIIGALERGADDYMTKPFSFDFLEAKIRALFRRTNQSPDQSLVKCLDIVVDLRAHRALLGKEPLSLTQKEFDLLCLFIKSPSRVFTRNQLLNSVWGYDADLISRTVDAHVASLRKKLGHCGGYIKTVPKIGYLWEPVIHDI
jgi:two-component system phosphate regulon response regulator PhoB